MLVDGGDVVFCRAPLLEGFSTVGVVRVGSGMHQ